MKASLNIPYRETGIVFKLADFMWITHSNEMVSAKIESHLLVSRRNVFCELCFLKGCMIVRYTNQRVLAHIRGSQIGFGLNLFCFVIGKTVWSKQKMIRKNIPHIV